MHKMYANDLLAFYVLDEFEDSLPSMMWI
jgi:hypothetical protein